MDFQRQKNKNEKRSSRFLTLVWRTYHTLLVISNQKLVVSKALVVLLQEIDSSEKLNELLWQRILQMICCSASNYVLSLALLCMK